MSTLNEKLTLHFTPYAWRKLLFFRDCSYNEVGALAVSDKKDPFIIRDLRIPKQAVTPASVDFDMDDVADLYSQLDGEGFSMNEYARIWIHTHPGNSPNPSGTDENTFEANYGKASWAIMFILAKGGKAYARLRLGKPIPIQLQMDVAVHWTCPFEATNEVDWAKTYKEKVSVELPATWVNNLPTVSGHKKIGDSEVFRESRRPVFPEEELEVINDADWWEDVENDVDSPMDPLEEMTYEQYLASLRDNRLD